MDRGPGQVPARLEAPGRSADPAENPRGPSNVPLWQSCDAGGSSGCLNAQVGAGEFRVHQRRVDPEDHLLLTIPRETPALGKGDAGV